MEAQLPPTELARLETLRRYNILDTPQEGDFDDLVRLAAHVCGTPISLVSLVDKDRQWFKGHYGLEASETPRRLSFCAHSILQAPALVEVKDASKDPRFADNELVTGGLRIRFYAAAPLVSPEGHPLGTLCVIDTVPRQLRQDQKDALRVLARQVMVQMELRRRMAELERASRELAASHLSERSRQEAVVWERTTELARTNEQLRRSEGRFRALADASFEGILFHESGRIVDCNDQLGVILGRTREELLGRRVTEFIPPEEHGLALRGAREHCETTLDVHARRKDGSVRVLEVHGRPLGDEQHLRVATLRDVTERVQAQEAVRQSEARLGGIVNSAMDAIISIDEERCVVLFNPAAERLFGVTAGEALGQSLDRFIPERFRAGHLRAIEAFGRSGATSRRLGGPRTLWGLRANGEEFPLEASISQVQVQGAKLFTIILRDITERHQAEERLRESEAFSRQIVASLQEGLVVLDRDLRYRAWNPFMESVSGLTVQQVIGRHPDELFPWMREQGLIGLLERALAGESILAPDTLAYSPANGRSMWTTGRLGPLRDTQGRVVGVIASLQDITERKLAEKALRQSEERFRIMVDAIPQLAVIAAPDGNACWFNRRWYEYTGTRPEEVEGWGWQSMLDPQVRPRVVEQWRHSIASSQPFDMEFPLRGADGVFHPFLTRVLPLKDEQGRVTSWFGTATDIREIVAAREALARNRDELERLVQERTAQLVEANANLQNFAYTAAHDLRSPLRGISSFSTIVLARYGPQLDDMGRSMLERLVESTEQMGRLLTDLLEYSKLSQANLQLHKVSLKGSVEEALALLESDIRAKQAAIQVGPGLPPVLGHPATVVMLLSNLVSNALKFISPGVQPQLRIRAETLNPQLATSERSDTPMPREISNGFVRLWVEDNGIGIAVEDQEKVFEAFQRLHGKQEYPGTGLGLALVRKGAERMGGRVGVESEPGKGSRFWVEFRASQSEETKT